MLKIILYSLLLFISCTYEGKMAEEDRNKEMRCVDTRDGETFYFNTSTVTDLRVGILCSTSFYVVTSDSVKKRLTSDMELYIKCVEVKK